MEDFLDDCGRPSAVSLKGLFEEVRISVVVLLWPNVPVGRNPPKRKFLEWVAYRSSMLICNFFQ
jgi:hypothetical protein